MVSATRMNEGIFFIQSDNSDETFGNEGGAMRRRHAAEGMGQPRDHEEQPVNSAHLCKRKDVGNGTRVTGDCHARSWGGAVGEIPQPTSRRRIVEASAFLAFSCLNVLGACAYAQKARDGLTVRQSVEASRILGQDGVQSVIWSPDRSRFVAATIRGDLSAQGNWVELITGSARSLAEVRASLRTWRLFTRSGQTNPLRKLENIFWLDNERITFRWSSSASSGEVKIVNLRTGAVATPVQYAAPLHSISSDAKGKTIAFVASSLAASSVNDSMRAQGFVVSSASLHPLLLGFLDGRTPWNSGQVFVASPDGSHEVPLPSSTPGLSPPRIWMSPDGRWLIIEAPVTEIPPEWSRYRGVAYDGQPFSQLVSIARQNPGEPSRVTRLWLFDIVNRRVEPFWDAPSEWARTRILWSADSASVVLGPTYLPGADVDSLGWDGDAVVEVSVPDRAISPILGSNDARMGPRSWLPDGALELNNDDGSTSLTLLKRAETWRPVGRAGQTETPSVQIVWAQNYDQSPRLVAHERRTGRERVLLALNVELSKDAPLGGVEPVHWADETGRTWTASLYYPAHFVAGHRYPLVIQSHPFSPPSDQYSLNGNDSITTAFAAQPLAGRDLFVLQMAQPDGGLGDEIATPNEWPIMYRGYASAVRNLAARRIVDTARIGLVGFSRSGQYVEYALTQSEFRIAAAVISDNSDPSYVQYLTSPLDVQLEYERTLGAQPFGTGLAEWLRRSPGFNTASVNAPLRLERASGDVAAVTGSWELFSLLRRQGKPVELAVVPEIDNSSHVLELPQQILSSQQGTVDWMDFWLNGHEISDPARDDQYRRWRALKELHKTCYEPPREWDGSDTSYDPTLCK
jgi:dipeptidyl aminopeptidase/acylaminoacyl peptidase